MLKLPKLNICLRMYNDLPNNIKHCNNFQKFKAKF